MLFALVAPLQKLSVAPDLADHKSTYRFETKLLDCRSTLALFQWQISRTRIKQVGTEPCCIPSSLGRCIWYLVALKTSVKWRTYFTRSEKLRALGSVPFQSWSLSEVCQGKWGCWQLNYSTVTLFCVLFPVAASDLSAVLVEWAWAIAPWNTHRCRISNTAVAVTTSPACAKTDITNQSLDWLVDITNQGSFVSWDVAPEFSACASALSLTNGFIHSFHKY